MKSTISLFDERKEEVTRYFETLCDLEANPPPNSKVSDPLFFKILKSNFLLMLYNLVEASIVSGIKEIYELMGAENPAYKDLSDKIKELWISEQTYSFVDPSFNREAYKKKVKKIVEQAIGGASISLSDTIKRNGGNYDEKVIKDLCDEHGIRYIASDANGDLRKVKTYRNHLAHGIESFSNCARDLTVDDLKNIMDGVINFIRSILAGMETYYNNKSFFATQ